MVVNVKKTMMAAAGGGGYWWSLIGDGTDRYSAQQIYVDSNDDIFVAGRIGDSPSNQVFAKLDTNGGLSWSREITWDTSSFGDCKGIDDTSTGYLAVGGGYNNNNKVAYAEINKTDGTINSQQGFTQGSSSQPRGYPGIGPVIDDNDDAWFVFYGIDTSEEIDRAVGCCAWDHSTSTWDMIERFSGVPLDGSPPEPNYITRTPNRQRQFVACYHPGGNGSAFIAELPETSGTALDWAYRVENSGAVAYGIHADASYVYPVIRGLFISGVDYGIEVSKVDMDSPSSRTWARYLTSVSGSLAEAFPRGVTTDSSGNVYVGARRADALAMYIHKWNSSGVYQDAFYIECDGTNITSTSIIDITIDSNDDLYVWGSVGATAVGDRKLLLVKVPSDFSVSGTYGDMTFGTDTTEWTDGASTLTWGADGTGLDNGSINTHSNSVTNVAGGLSSTVTSV